TDPAPMLEHLGDRLGERKLRLCACAWARQLGDRIVDPRCRDAVLVAERYADGLATAAELHPAYPAADGAWADIPQFTGSPGAMRQWTRGRAASKSAARIARNAAHPDLNRIALRSGSWGRGKAMFALASILREQFGPLPFRPNLLDPAWLAWDAGTVRRL